MGEVTNIKHVIAPPLGQYPRGDLVFDIGTVIRGVDKGWPMMVIETDRNDFLARFGIPRRLSDDGYHAYLALYNHESTVGHYVRVVDSAAKYPYMEFAKTALYGAGSVRNDWESGSSYSKGDIVQYTDGKLYVSSADDNISEPTKTDADWASYTEGEWTLNITYSEEDIVQYTDGKLYVSSADDNISEPTKVDASWRAMSTVSSGAESFDTKISAGGDNFMTAWLKNGATDDDTYGFEISDLNSAKETFQVSVYEKINGEAKLAEGPFTAGLTPGSTKADGSPLFIEAVFEQSSRIVGFEVDEEGADFSMIAAESLCWFKGGDPGGDPSDADYKQAWDLLKKAEVDQLFMAGDVNTEYIKYALETADKKQIRLEADAIGGTPEAASEWVKSNMGIFQSHLLSFTYGRVSFKDPFYSGSRKNLGASGFATAAKAYGRDYSKTMIDAGVEEVPAGENFGLLRGVAGVRNETLLSEEDQEVLAKNWLNYIINSSNAGIIFWEQFTCYGDESPLAYKRIVDVMNYVYKIHREIMRANQFRGKSDEQIINLLSPPLRRLQTKGVLVPDPGGESEFPDPFKIWITTAGHKRQIHRMMRISRAIGPIILETILA